MSFTLINLMSASRILFIITGDPLIYARLSISISAILSPFLAISMSCSDYFISLLQQPVCMYQIISIYIFVYNTEIYQSIYKQQVTHISNIRMSDQKVKIPAHILQRRNQIEKRMVESGQMERLEEYLRKKLINSGWKQDLKSYCKDIIREKGIERVTVQDLIQALQSHGKHMIPISIREDMLSRVRKYLQQTGNTVNTGNKR